uniref:Uncharacterized protein n=1 Tax=Arundo donax TaxID=35708 RepID=A0A0A9HIZ5_ARUDO
MRRAASTRDWRVIERMEDTGGELAGQGLAVANGTPMASMSRQSAGSSKTRIPLPLRRRGSRFISPLTRPCYCQPRPHARSGLLSKQSSSSPTASTSSKCSRLHLHLHGQHGVVTAISSSSLLHIGQLSSVTVPAASMLMFRSSSVRSLWHQWACRPTERSLFA